MRLFGGACSYTVFEFDPLLDSSSMTPKDWETIAATVEKHYYDYDGFVVIHGTDTPCSHDGALVAASTHENVRTRMCTRLR